MHNLIRLAPANGGAISLQSTDATGIPRSEVSAALRAGRLHRIRKGWFATPDAPRDVVRAIRVGGILTAGSAARLHGLWTLDDSLLHVRVPRTASRLASPDDRGTSLDAVRDLVCVHYAAHPAAPRGCDDIERAVVEMFRCADVRAAMVAFESALNQSLLRPWEVQSMRGHVPGRCLRQFDRVDSGAQSGLETLVRMLLFSRRVRYRTQVWIERVGRVDILIGDRLVLELDGARFHTGRAFEDDRRRDFELVQADYLVVRITYRMVMEQWDDVAAGILKLVRRGEHLRRRGASGSAGSATT
jgi:very-short-patch-repair endonuclease